jgi:hypothetical protein
VCGDDAGCGVWKHIVTQALLSQALLSIIAIVTTTISSGQTSFVTSGFVPRKEEQKKGA